jgi:uncharacterized repeat protein (TIGR01451 family)
MIHRIVQKIKATRIIILAVALLTFCFITSGTNGPLTVGTNDQIQATVPSNCGLLKGCEVVYNSFSCTPDNCSEYAGVFSSLKEGAPVPGVGRIMPSRKGEPDIRVTKTYNETIDGKHISYTIDVNNDGGQRLEGVELVDMLPPGLEYQNSSPKEDFKERGANCINLTWLLGDLNRGDTRKIKMNVTKLGSAIQPEANKAYVHGNWTNATVIVTVIDTAMAEEEPKPWE